MLWCLARTSLTQYCVNYLAFSGEIPKWKLINYTDVDYYPAMFHHPHQNICILTILITLWWCSDITNLNSMSWKTTYGVQIMPQDWTYGIWVNIWVMTFFWSLLLWRLVFSLEGHWSVYKLQKMYSTLFMGSKWLNVWTVAIGIMNLKQKKKVQRWMVVAFMYSIM